MTDPADNPLSGGIGDTPALLAALLAAGLEEQRLCQSGRSGVVECARAAGEAPCWTCAWAGGARLAM